MGRVADKESIAARGRSLSIPTGLCIPSTTKGRFFNVFPLMSY
jgi:hypothetical protein